jgi:hypothetical protein
MPGEMTTAPENGLTGSYLVILGIPAAQEGGRVADMGQVRGRLAGSYCHTPPRLA